MLRNDPVFVINYSIRLETMQAQLLARIDKLINFSQLLLGAAVITVTHPVATGLAVAALGAIAFVYQPGSNSTRSLIQKQKYESLLGCVTELDDNELQKRILALQESDALVLTSLKLPAYVATCLAQGSEVPANSRPSAFERFMARCAGEPIRRSAYE